MPKEDVMFEASKVFVAGIIGAIAMLSSEAIKTWLLSIPGLNAVLILPVPFTDETIGDALSLCVSAVMGAILSTIAIYFMDKCNNQSKTDKLQIQIMTQGGVVVQYKITQNWFVLIDSWETFAKSGKKTIETLENSRNQIEQSATKAQKAINELKDVNTRLDAVMQKLNQN